MALNENLNGKTEQQLIDDSDFIKALVAKLKAEVDDLGVYTKTDADTAFAKVDGTNATPAGVNTMLGTLKDKVVKASELPTKVTEKAVVDVLVPALATVGTDTSKQVYTKADADTAFVQTSGLTNTLKTEVVKPDVVDVLVPALATVGTDTSKQVYTKADADTAFVQTSGLTNTLKTEVVKPDVVDVLVPALATVGTDTSKQVYTKADADTAFVQTSGLTNTLKTEVVKPDVVDVLVPALATVGTDTSKQVYTKADADTAFAKVDGTNATPAGVNTMLGTLKDKVVKASELPTKVTEKAVVDVLVPALATVGTDTSKQVYTKADADTAFVQTSGLTNTLKTEVVKPDVVDVLVPALATVGTDTSKQVYTKADADTAFAKVDGTNATPAGVNAMLGQLTGTDKVVKTGTLPAKVAEPAVVNALVPALAKGVDNKGIYTKKGVDDAFVRNDGSNAGAIVNALTKDPTFTNAAKIHANAGDAGFQSAVREVISQPYFDIPADDSTPITAYW